MEGKAWSPARAASSSSVKIQIDFPCFTLKCVSRHTPIMDQLPSVAANVHLMPIFGFCSGKTPTIRSSSRSRRRGPKRCRDGTFVFWANTVGNEVALVLNLWGRLHWFCCKILTIWPIELCLKANERAFEALYNGHRFSYVSMIGVYRTYQNATARISKVEFCLVNQGESFYSFFCKI